MESVVNVLLYVRTEDISSAVWLPKQKVLYNNIFLNILGLIQIPVLNVVTVCWPPSDETEANCILLFKSLS